MDINNLILLNNFAEESGRKNRKLREIYSSLAKHTDNTIAALFGPRGSGKTILLKQLLAQSKNGFYISIDTLTKNTDLFDLVLTLNKDYHYQVFFLDEIHFLPEINKYLKMIFDNLKVKLYVTSSISLQLIQSAHDLSRRVKVFSIDYFSYLEFLNFNDIPSPQKLTWAQVLSKDIDAEYSKILPYFKKFVSGGNVPISLETQDVVEALRRNLEKVIQSDIPKLRSLLVDELSIIMDVFLFVARSPVSDLNPNVVAKNLKITRYKALQYIQLLEDAFILKSISPYGTNLTQEPKIICRLPYRLLENSYEDCIGGLREDFAIDCLINAGLNVKYLKSKTGSKTPDLFVSDPKLGSVVVEIGGAGKTYNQFKGVNQKYPKLVFADHFDLKKNTLPLALLGTL
jgi:predicted AAA+ superfamily ATPase